MVRKLRLGCVGHFLIGGFCGIYGGIPAPFGHLFSRYLGEVGFRDFRYIADICSQQFWFRMPKQEVHVLYYLEIGHLTFPLTLARKTCLKSSVILSRLEHQTQPKMHRSLLNAQSSRILKKLH